METRWRIELFGGLRLRRGEQAIARFRTRKAGSLLGYLAYYPDRLHSREFLIEMLWPEENIPIAQNKLRIALSSLRRQLEPPGVLTGSVLTTDRVRAGLNPASITTDAADFEAALRAAQGSGSPSEQEFQWNIAASLYCGPLLKGYEEDWSLPEQERLEALYFEALEHLIGRCEARGDVERALRLAHQGIGIDPLRETVHIALMRLSAASGQPLVGLRHYREWEGHLRRELDAEPSAPARARARELIRGLAGAAPAPINEPASPEITSGPSQPPLPSGTVTFLMIEGSGLNRQFRQALARHGGRLIEDLGPCMAAVFAQAREALACAASLTRQAPSPLHAALDTAEARPVQGRYPADALACARHILGAGHDGLLLCSEATEALLRHLPGYQWRGLGAYRLHGADAPRRLFQVGPSDTPLPLCPPLKALRADQAHLPLPSTRFFGREEELAQLVSLLREPQARLVPLLGTAGVGKTRLALEAMRRIESDYEGPVRFVSLASLPDAGQIGEAILSALRIPRLPQVEPFDQAVAGLSSHRQVGLLALDNFERLTEGGAVLVALLLERVETLTVLVTSRQRLNLPEERVFPVSPLPVPTEDAFPAGESLNPCVKLFLDRAQRARPDFQITPGNAAAVFAMCRKLEGIPLALELAAARMRALSPRQMLEKLSDRFHLLTGGGRSASYRQQTLKATIDWSYDLLAEPKRLLLRRLAVFRGGWTLAAAESVCEGSGLECRDAPELLTALIDRSLVEAEEHSGELRYRMLEMIREYAQERLAESGEEARLREKHLGYYLALAEEAEPRLRGPEQIEWLDRLEEELENLRLALSSAENGAGLRLAGALGEFWYLRGYWNEGRGWLEKMLARCPDQTIWRAKGLSWAGYLAGMQQDYTPSRDRLDESIALYRDIGDKRGLAWALFRRGYVGVQSEFIREKDTQDQLDESWSLFKVIGDRVGMGELMNLAEDPEDSLALYKQLGDRVGMAWALLHMGWIAASRGEYDTGRMKMQSGLALMRELKDIAGTARLLLCLGSKEAERGEFSLARAQLEESLLLYRAVGNNSGVAYALMGLGYLDLHSGNDHLARDRCQQALEICFDDISESQMLLGQIALRQGQTVVARAWLAKALPCIPKRWTSSYWISALARAMELMAAVLISEGQPERAACLYGFAETIRLSMSVILPPVERPDYEYRVAALRSALSEEEFSSAWARGKAMSIEEAIAYALSL
ncbi:MAG: winged helix-turn-helix domain-containing protein [Armatimonadetes bacterium]|nr:winged helix-turn-helix domain-containing protein [Armatimonadota bacterium]